MATDKRETKFNQLRIMYLAQSKALDECKSCARSKCGEGWQESWLSKSEQRQLESTRNRLSKAESVFFDYLTSISPRDWSYGVPCHWLYEKLSFADAVRPIGERLSVVPPMSFGSTVPRS
jgi:hypothetical protein